MNGLLYDIREWWARFRGRRTMVIVSHDTELEDEENRAVELQTGDTVVVSASPEDNSITLDWAGGDEFTLTFEKGDPTEEVVE